MPALAQVRDSSMGTVNEQELARSLVGAVNSAIWNNGGETAFLLESAENIVHWYAYGYGPT